MTGHDEGSGTQVVRALHAGYNDRDRARMLECLAEDVVWHVAGTHPAAGSFSGRDALWERHLEPLWPSPARVVERDLVDRGEYVVALVDWAHDFGDGERLWKGVEVFRLEGGRVTERWEFTSGQAELDELITRGCEAPEGELLSEADAGAP